MIAPLETLPSPPAAIADWTAATDQQRADWTAAYSDALAAAPDNDPAKVADGDYGPVPALTGALLEMARQGNLDGVLQGGGNFYNMDYTRSLLFLGDGSYFPDLAASQHLTGDQWGVMNETGDTPGQSWLWLFSLLYQVEPFKSSPNADALVVVDDARADRVADPAPVYPRSEVAAAEDTASSPDLERLLPEPVKPPAS